MIQTIALPKTVSLILEKHIKIYLQHCKIVQTLAGRLCVVSHNYGEGYYGPIRGDTFFPSSQCTKAILAELQDVEQRGLEAIKSIGLLTGRCCLCGRTLTDETSIAEGIGPICGNRAFGTAYKAEKAESIALNLFD